MINLPKIDFKKDQPKMMVLIALVAILILVLYSYLILGPQIERLTDVLERSGKIISELKMAELLISKKDEFNKYVESSREKVEYYEKRLPVEQEIPSLLENLSNMAKSSNIKIIGITPLPLSPKEVLAQKGKIYKEIPILINAKSGYHELGMFLNKLENADRFMKVVDIEIKTNKQTPKKHDVELIVCTYILAKER